MFTGVCWNNNVNKGICDGTVFERAILFSWLKQLQIVNIFYNNMHYCTEIEECIQLVSVLLFKLYISEINIPTNVFK